MALYGGGVDILVGYAGEVPEMSWRSIRNLRGQPGTDDELKI
jgi:hypothetical protein